MTFSITGRAHTGRAERYGKQLAQHLGNSLPVTSEDGIHRVQYSGVEGAVTETDGSLEIAISAPDERLLFIAMDSIERHLVRFGEREGLAVEWDDAALEQRYRAAVAAQSPARDTGTRNNG